MDDVRLSRNLAAAAAGEPEDDDDREFAAWLAALPRAVRDVADRWELRLGAPYEPGGTSAWAGPVTGVDGRPYALKVGWVHDEARDEAAGLRAWDGHGAIRVHRAETAGRTVAMLLERCEPGTTLRSRPEPEQDVVVTDLLRRLWAATPPGAAASFRPLAVMADDWLRRRSDRLAADGTALDPGLVREGIATFRELAAPTGAGALLVTDLHAGNVLAAEREPWLVIDPKPYLGDPAYDVLQHLMNCHERLLADPRGLACRVAGLAGLDAGRVERWLFARTVYESPRWPGLGDVARALAP